MRYALLLVFLALSACQSGALPDSQRLLIVCEGWSSVFTRIDTRDRLGMASKREVAAIDKALPVLNPICTMEAPSIDALEAGFDILTLEAALIAVLSAQGEST